MSCSICMINKVSDIQCIQCSNSICTDCYDCISKCPFCRHTEFGNLDKINNILFVIAYLRTHRGKETVNKYLRAVRLKLPELYHSIKKLVKSPSFKQYGVLDTPANHITILLEAELLVMSCVCDEHDECCECKSYERIYN